MDRAWRARPPALIAYEAVVCRRPACPGHPRLYANGQRSAEFAWGSWMSFAEPRPFSAVDSVVIRHDWTRAEVRALFALPFPDLIFRAQTIHRQHFDPTEVQISTLIS